MEKIVLVLSVMSVLLSSSALAQTTDWSGVGGGTASEAVAVLATKPTITGDKKFRVVFSLRPLIETDIPYAVLYTNSGTHGWQAVTSKSRNCTVSRRSGISNVPYISGSNEKAGKLVSYDGSNASMGKNRPIYLVADFNCDGLIFEGDEVTIQSEFFFRLNLEWKKANYLFDKRVLEK